MEMYFIFRKKKKNTSEAPWVITALVADIRKFLSSFVFFGILDGTIGQEM